jgi:hydrogenase maturation protease
MNENEGDIIVLGYGNAGCRDDGLGTRFACTVEKLHIKGVTVVAKSLLTVEDATSIALHDVVIFVDASLDGPEPFRFERIRPDFTRGFGSHRIEPPAMLALARGIFGARTEGYILGIRGYAFERFDEGLSAKARKNLQAALDFVVPVLRRAPLRKELTDILLPTADSFSRMRLSHV